MNVEAILKSYVIGYGFLVWVGTWCMGTHSVRKASHLLSLFAKDALSPYTTHLTFSGNVPLDGLSFHNRTDHNEVAF